MSYFKPKAAPTVSLSPERMAKFREYAEEYPNLRSALNEYLRFGLEAGYSFPSSLLCCGRGWDLRSAHG